MCQFIRVLAVVAVAVASGGSGSSCIAAEALPKLPEGVRAEFDIPYAATDNPRQQLDLYLPTKITERSLPLLVFIHGGGWRAGSKRAGTILLPLVQSGEYAIASVGYRFTDEAIWPAQIHDCKAAIRWLRGNAATYGIDPDRIGVAGSSAGGHLVCLLGTTCGIADIEGTLGEHRDQPTHVSCVVNQFGPTDFLHIEEANGTAKDLVSKLLGGRPDAVPDIAREASPVTHVSKDDAPVICIHGTADPLVPYSQSTKLDEACEAAGVECLVLTIQDGGHGGFANPEIILRTKQFIDRHRLGREASISEEPIPATAGR
ncbi:MAG: alpha/beta hydrolase fold domain-containing protein [Planctomycetaceae bacterium]